MKKSGKQHAEIGDARTSQAWEDTQLVGNILKDRSPFEFEETFAIFLMDFIHINDLNAEAIGYLFLKK